MIKVYIMSTCPDCQVLMDKLNDTSQYEVIDIGTHVLHMKQFIHIRDTSPAMEEARKKRMGRNTLFCAGRWNRNPRSKTSGPCIKISHLKRELRKKQKKPLAFFLSSCYYLIVVMTDRGIAQLIEQRSPKP